MTDPDLLRPLLLCCAGSQTSSQPYQSQLPHQGGGSQPPAYAGQSSGQTGYPGQGGTGGFPQAGQVTGSSTGYGTGGGPGPVTGQTNPTGVKQVCSAWARGMGFQLCISSAQGSETFSMACGHVA